jgi:DNA-binding response OmpR family regulator
MPALAAVRPLPLERSVLVIEADPDIQAQVARTMRANGFRVVGTSSGDGALALISEWPVDLILVSQELPGRAGVEVTRLLRERCPTSTVVVMASRDEPSVQEAARAAGAVGCVHKPVSVASIRHWLEPMPHEAPSLLSTAATVAE